MHSPSPIPSPPPVLDEVATLKRLRWDTDFLSSLYQIFLEDMPPKLKTLEKALEQNAPDNIQRAAHAIKGAAATIGATALIHDAKHLEDTALSSSPETICHAINAVRHSASLTLEYIAKALAIR